ncbi:MAG: polysaccharide biosynthesis/export family protein [Cyclobacteriaceae bacterium]
MRNLLFLVLGILFTSCGSYKQNIMFKATETAKPETFKREASATEKNYVIQKNDLIKLDVFSNKGEKIIDPNPELTTTPTTNANATQANQFNYLVELNGLVKFPMIGELKIEGLTLRQAEEIAQKEYTNYFKEPFVVISYVNKRVIVLGALGGQVIPLTNQNVTLVEVLALAKGLNNDAKAQNIKLIRNDHVYQVDFSTIQGFKDGNMLVEPGDVVYVEPIRRPFTEALRDNFTIISVIVSLATLVAVVRTLN